MTIRETLNQSKIAPIALVAVVIVALAIIIWQLRGPSTRVSVGKAFYTDDDGATWFEETADKIPPFDHNGKEAVRAHVFVSTSGGKPFVGYLERYTKQAKEAIEKQLTEGGEVPNIAPLTEVKRPMDPKARWYPEDHPAHEKIMEVKAPDGSQNIKSVSPGDKY